MLITRPNIRIVTKEVTLEGGKKALAYFAVRGIFGVLEVKFLGTKVVEDSVEDSVTARVLLLEKPREVVWGESPIVTLYETFSPYFSLDLLINQLARAPSVK